MVFYMQEFRSKQLDQLLATVRQEAAEKMSEGMFPPRYAEMPIVYVGRVGMYVGSEHCACEKPPWRLSVQAPFRGDERALTIDRTINGTPTVLAFELGEYPVYVTYVPKFRAVTNMARVFELTDMGVPTTLGEPRKLPCDYVHFMIHLLEYGSAMTMVQLVTVMRDSCDRFWMRDIVGPKATAIKEENKRLVTELAQLRAEKKEFETNRAEFFAQTGQNAFALKKRALDDERVAFEKERKIFEGKAGVDEIRRLRVAIHIAIEKNKQLSAALEEKNKLFDALTTEGALLLETLSK
jgi:hypothetical protein